MKSLPRAALIGLAMLLPTGTTHAADPVTVEKPAPVVGTRWRAVVSDGLSKAPISDTTHTVASVTDSEVVILNAAGEEVLALDTAHYAVKRMAGRVFEPPLQRLRFPLAVGNKWDSTYRYDHPQCGATEAQVTLKVAGWEDITTADGKVRALRIDSAGRWRNSCGSDRVESKYWAIPDLAVPLKHEVLIYARGRVSSYEVHEMLGITRP